MAVINWTGENLEKVKASDPWLSTLLMNTKNLSKKESPFYPYRARKTYIFYLEYIDGENEIYATDDTMAKRYITTYYTTADHPIVLLSEKTTTYRTVIDLEE